MIATEIQSLSPSTIVELFELDATGINAGIFRFHAGTNSLESPVVWQGYEYSPMPIEAEGFDLSSQGTLPRPKIRVANISGILSQMSYENSDLIGCRLTRKRTFVKYLDAVNFQGGNENADPNQYFPSDTYIIDKKASENRYVIEWELSSALDLHGITIPRRQVIQNTCMWKYKSSECGYQRAAYFTNRDEPCVAALDSCGKTMNSCKLRFGNAAELPFGGFPGAQRYA